MRRVPPALPPQLRPRPGAALAECVSELTAAFVAQAFRPARQPPAALKGCATSETRRGNAAGRRALQPTLPIPPVPPYLFALTIASMYLPWQCEQES